LTHCDLRALSRADWTAGRSSPTSVPMMAMTTSSSTSVNALRRLEGGAEHDRHQRAEIIMETSGDASFGEAEFPE
jgi:hypothetical protein